MCAVVLRCCRAGIELLCRYNCTTHNEYFSQVHFPCNMICSKANIVKGIYTLPNEVPCRVATQDAQNAREHRNPLLEDRKNAQDATLDSPHQDIKHGCCYAAPAHQIQEIYGYRVGPQPEPSAHASDAGYFFLLTKFLKSQQLPKSMAGIHCLPVIPFHNLPPIY